MKESDYTVAGWLAIVQTVLFPLSIGLGIVEAGIANGLMGYNKPFIGPADIMMVIFTAIAIYTLLMFRKLLHEHYNYHDLICLY